ncbi:MAG TPA: AarF/ABC1/UbiB kinase family protein, partial [Bellilinea sp.]|nr:AarF/ABC1/UbiB kinase family protein [Bellilinea sp.]
RSIRHWQRYREIVGIFLRHGFGFAFSQLEPDWNFFRNFLRLPSRKKPSTPSKDLATHFRLALEELGPTFVKFGQILSTRPDLLPPAYITELSKLQDDVPPTPWESIREVLIRELGRDPEQVFLTIDLQPMAAASLAQVHAATLPDGQEVVVKTQRPGINAVIDTDLEILSSLAVRAQTTRWGKVYDFVGIANDFAFTLRNELDYRREGRNADRFRENFAHETHLYIPQVYWGYSSQRVLVLERIHGIKIDDLPALDLAGYDRHRIALHSARIIIKEVLEDGFFHADPHPGNYNVMPGEVIGAMDFGMVGYLRDQDRLNLIRLYLVAVALDADGIVDQLIRMGAAGAEVDRTELARDIGRLLTKYYALPLKEIRAREVVEEIMPIAFHHHLRLPSDLWLLGKTLAMMEGIGLQLDPDFDVFAVAQPFVRRMLLNIVMPNSGWARAAVLGGANWSELLNRLPQAGNRMLERIERDEPIKLRIDDIDKIINRFDRLFTRLSLSVLVGALIIGLAFLVSRTSPNIWGQRMIIGGFVAIISLGIWLIISLFRSRNK